ncbi:MAG: hypothetical protein AB8B63_05705 [Granulosicoccus sp.]
MDLNKIQNLEELSRKVAEKSQLAMKRGLQQLQQLDQQSDELNHINQEYQQVVVGDDRVTPRLLAMRRTFVSGLTDKLSEMSEERESLLGVLQQRVTEYREKTAQHAAIENVSLRRSKELEIGKQRQEQVQSEDAHRSLRHLHAMDGERNNV